MPGVLIVSGHRFVCHWCEWNWPVHDYLPFDFGLARIAFARHIRRRHGLKRDRVGRYVAVATLAAVALISAAAPAQADPPPPWADPHIPDRSHGSCPGGAGGFGVGWCDGVPYPDGTYWHQLTWSGQYSGSGGGKPVCMGPDHNPAPPGGCGGYA